MESANNLFQKRRSRRREVTLRGIFICPCADAAAATDTDARAITVQNISTHGMGFRTTTPMNETLNERFQVRFVLECEQRVTVETKDIIIRWTTGDFVGADFLQPIDDLESELDFYLAGKRFRILDE